MAYGGTMYLGECEEGVFLEACGSAKIVEGPDGMDALLVGGKVIKVEPAYLVSALSKALRRSTVNAKESEG